MLDDELKKQLREMDLDDVVDELEKNSDEKESNVEAGVAIESPKETAQVNTSSKQPFFSKSAFLLTIMLSCVGVGGYAYQNYIHFAQNMPPTPPQAQALVAQNSENHQEHVLSQAELDDDEQNEQEESAYDNEEEVNEEPVDTFNEFDKSLTISWAEKINQEDPEIGKSVQILWNMLERRQAELNMLADDVSDLLYENAKAQRDLYAKEAHVLFSRYQTANARYAFDIGQQMYKIDQMATQNKNPLVSQYIQELYAALDCKVYANYQLAFVKNLVKNENIIKQCLQALSQSETFAQIQKELLNIKKIFKNLEEDGLSQLFSQLVLLQQEIVEAVQQALSKSFQDNQVSVNADTEALLEAILAESGFDEKRKAYWKNEYYKLMKKPRQQKAATPKTKKARVHIDSETV